jgi:hypothetical protein
MTRKRNHIADGHLFGQVRRIDLVGVGISFAGFLQMYAHRQLAVVLTPRLMQLRGLVIGEAARFPELARVRYERGPQHPLAALAQTFERLAARGLPVIDDPLSLFHGLFEMVAKHSGIELAVF